MHGWVHRQAGWSVTRSGAGRPARRACGGPRIGRKKAKAPRLRELRGASRHACLCSDPSRSISGMTVSRHANVVSLRLSGGLGSAGVNRNAQAVIPWPWRRDRYGLVGGSSMRVSHPPGNLVAPGAGRSRRVAASPGQRGEPVRAGRNQYQQKHYTIVGGRQQVPNGAGHQDNPVRGAMGPEDRHGGWQ